MSRKRFSLLEVIVALAISLILLILSTSIYMYCYGGYLTLVATNELNQNGLILQDYLSKEYRDMGGGGSFAWMSMIAETSSNCPARAGMPACGRSDRVTTVTTIPGMPTGTVVFGFPSLGGYIVTLDKSAGCPLTSATIKQPINMTIGDYYLNLVLIAFDVPSCGFIAIPQTLTNGFDQSPPNLNGASFAYTDVKATYMDDTTHELHVFRDLNDNGSMDPGEDQILAENVYDFQVALGYDFNPADGRIEPNEWLYSSPGQKLGAGTFSTTTPKQLRMVNYTVTLGAPLPSVSFLKPNSVQNLDAPPVSAPGILLRTINALVMPRNTGTFQ